MVAQQSSRQDLLKSLIIQVQLTGANSCAITAGNVIFTTTNEPGNTYPNITGVHSILASGEGFIYCYYCSQGKWFRNN